MEKGKKIDKLTHTFGEWTVVVKPTTDRQGKKTRVCSKCGAKENAPIPRLGTKYSVTVTPSEHGIVVASKLTEIADGEEITLTVLPDTGYKLKTLTVTDSNGNKITLTDGKFIIPESNVTVGAEFIKSDINNM